MELESGPKPFTWSDDKVEQLRKLWAMGIGARQIAVLLGEGFTRSGVRIQAKKLNLPSQAPGSTCEASSAISSRTESST